MCNDVYEFDCGDLSADVKSSLSKSLGAGGCADATIPYTFNLAGQSLGADAYIVGRHTLKVVGTIKMKCDCSWSFDGKVSSALGYDPYDFNKSSRSLVKEIATSIGRNKCKDTARVFNIKLVGDKSVSASGKTNGTPTCCEK